ncbi:MAG: S41 family peptidase [Chloroflexota bacterium]
MPPRKWSELAWIVLLSVVWFGIGWLANGRFQPTNLTLFNQVLNGLSANQMGAVPDSRDLTYAALHGLVERLDDPHAAFLEPAVARRFQADFDGRTGVIGLFPEFQDGQWVVSVVLPGQTAAASGLQSGDILLAVDGVPVTAATTSPVISLLIRGPIGEPAQIVVSRDGVERLFTPIREERFVADDPQLLEGNIAYLAQYTFTANAPEVVAASLRQLMAQQPAALIWDLRSNGGGSMEATQQVLSYFIDDGVLFLAELQNGRQRTFAANGDGLATEIPLLVLIGERTYSSAETAAVAIADHNRGILIGEPTHGKGTIQEVVDLVDGSKLQYTVAHWLSPTGQFYEGHGVPPDLFVADDPTTETDEVLEFALTYIRENLLAESVTGNP